MRRSSETSNPGIFIIFYPYFPTGERILGFPNSQILKSAPPQGKCFNDLVHLIQLRDNFVMTKIYYIFESVHVLFSQKFKL